ncbi:MAG: arsenate reductase (glutaredoxin) [Bacteroidales bacterium]
MLTIYHNARCSKSREGLSFLKKKTTNFKVAEYMKNGISEDEIRDITSKINCSAHDIIRTQESIYKELYKSKDLSEDEWVKAIVSHPKLLQRPIIVSDTQAIIARPAEKINDIV